MSDVNPWPASPGTATLAVTEPDVARDAPPPETARQRPSDPTPTRRGGADRQRVLVTGGAGFIGTHVVDRLLARGCRVRVLDRLDPQVHGEGATTPRHLDPAAEFIQGDVADPAVV